MSSSPLSLAALPPWDIGRPQKAFVDLAGEIRGSVLDVGCGTGENALYFASLDHDVTGVDVSAASIAQAVQKADDRATKARFEVHDALDLFDLGARFDTIIDCGFFHGLTDDGRGAYLKSIGAALVPGGRLHLLTFSDRETGDRGPRRLSKPQLRSVFARGYLVDSIREARFESLLHPLGARAWMASFTRIFS